MHEAFMREALRLALASASTDGGPFGAVIVKEGRIIGRGQNSVVRELDPSAHAEIVAIRAACRALADYRLRGCVLYASCEPCPMCLGAIYWARIDRVYYAATRVQAAAVGFDDAVLYAELAKPSVERKLPVLRLVSEAGEAPFRRWADNPHQIPY